MLADDALVGDAYEAELPRMMAGVALIWVFATLVQVLYYLRDYRSPVIPLADWAGMLGAAWQAGVVIGRF